MEVNVNKLYITLQSPVNSYFRPHHLKNNHPAHKVKRAIQSIKLYVFIYRWKVGR